MRGPGPEAQRGDQLDVAAAEPAEAPDAGCRRRAGRRRGEAMAAPHAAAPSASGQATGRRWQRRSIRYHGAGAGRSSASASRSISSEAPGHARAERRACQVHRDVDPAVRHQQARLAGSAGRAPAGPARRCGAAGWPVAASWIRAACRYVKRVVERRRQRRRGRR